ncbi:D-glycero-beta-D-manno-heptose 1-phosphate adenylyltransferase [Desulfogranum japonicum]|uniref:D-glycero-beta-D-manno-heptose 1-phosphate adenylyltransferase n=1 Tax=Desulfogranum japonicum TaxID=231447 RepID=UPI000414D403|nr:D-glycero-beta-D-manno-heptose 1-phosphate adenylyltransferase [Desulfogranum japonicum]
MTHTVFPAIGFIQIHVVPGEPEHNLRQVVQYLEEASPPPGTLLILPELWATGFDYSRTRELAEHTPDLLEKMKELASRYNVLLAGSFALLDEADCAPFNTLLCVTSEGVAGQWPKQHLFRHWQEDAYYQPGQAAPPLALKQGTIGGFVCYDLRFPEIARNLAYQGAQIVMVSAQWPKIRLDHWQTLLRARAIENQVFLMAANGCGTSGPLELAGHSMLISPSGEILAEADDAPGCRWCAIDGAILEEERRWFSPPGERMWGRDDQDKILVLHDVTAKLTAIRRQGAKVAFTNGCFDLLHAGHVSYLERARQCADCLVVGLNSDDSIRRLKGETRPVNTELERARVLAALGCVDFIVIFTEDTPYNLIQAVMPEVLVKGADWPEDLIVGAKEVKQAGGRVERIAFTYNQSTSHIIQKISGHCDVDQGGQ